MNRIILFSSDTAFRSSFIKKEPFINPDNQIVLTTGDIAHTINYIQEFPVDIVFIDTGASIRQSLSLIYSITASHSTAKIIIIGSSQSFEIAMSALRNGAFDYLVKPIDTVQLESVFDRINTLTQVDSSGIVLLTENEYSALFHLLSGRDHQFLDFLDKLFVKALMNRNMKDYDIQLCFYKLFLKLLKDCESVYPYISSYYSQKDIDCLSPVHIYSLPEQENLVAEIGQELLYIITHFHLSTSSELIQKVNQYVWTHVEDKISLENLAKHFYVNKSYLSHLFKIETGQNFMTYYTEIRMLHSRILLQQHYKIYECALALGYEDTEYFSKVFKKYYGVRPTEYVAIRQDHKYHSDHFILLP